MCSAVAAVSPTIGIGLAYLLHLKDRAKADAHRSPECRPSFRCSITSSGSMRSTTGLIVEPLRKLGQFLANVFDRGVIDGLVTLAGGIPQVGGIILKITVQRGFLQGYAAAMLFGIAIILLIIFMH